MNDCGNYVWVCESAKTVDPWSKWSILTFDLEWHDKREREQILQSLGLSYEAWW